MAEPEPAPTDTDEDWPAQAADTGVRLGGQVRDKTTGPAITIARGIVYGLLASLLVLAAGILLAIAAVRLLDAYLPSSVFGDSHTWAAHLVIGLVFSLGGLVLWRQRRAPDADG